MKVLTQTGVESTLFNDIVKLPIIASKEQALDVYTALFSKVDSMSSQIEPNLIFKSDSKVFQNYKSAISSGESFEIGVYDSNYSFNKVIDVESNFNQKTFEGFVN